MKKQYKNHILAFLLIFLLSFYVISVYQNCQEKQSFKEGHESNLKNQYKIISELENEPPQEYFIIEKISSGAMYVSKTYYSELELVSSNNVSSLIPFKSAIIIRGTMNYTCQLTSCIGDAFVNYKSNLAEHIHIFEDENNIKTEDWNEKHWKEFLEPLSKELPDFEDVHKYLKNEEELEKMIKIHTNIKALKGFNDRCVERYKTNIENDETDKALFNLKALKSINNLVKNGGELEALESLNSLVGEEERLTYPEETSLIGEYFGLIKQNLKCSIPIALGVWIVYIIFYKLIEKRA